MKEVFILIIWLFAISVCSKTCDRQTANPDEGVMVSVERSLFGED